MTANQIAVFPQIPETEQYLVLPGSYSWQQLQTLTTSLGDNCNLKIYYLDGKIELLTTGEKHETISRLISILLGLYFWQRQIEFIPVGSATRESREKSVSFAPDESYYPHSARQIVIYYVLRKKSFCVTNVVHSLLSIYTQNLSAKNLPQNPWH